MGTNRNIWTLEESKKLVKNVNELGMTEGCKQSSLALGRTFAACMAKYYSIVDKTELKPIKKETKVEQFDGTKVLEIDIKSLNIDLRKGKMQIAY